MELKTDYHIHTNCSDGTKSPVEVVKMAKAANYDIISITDHDGIDGVKEALIAGEAVELKIVPGVEVSAKDENGISMHILGYNINIKDLDLNYMLEEMRVKRKSRNDRFMAALNSAGYELALNDLDIVPGGDYIGRPIFARALVKKGYVDNEQKAFDDIFSIPEIKSIKKEKVDVARAIKTIKKAGGTPVLAHPGLIKGLGDKYSEEYYRNLENLLVILKACGLAGMECYYPKHTAEAQLRFVDIAERYHLHITNGSDYHGRKGEEL